MKKNIIYSLRMNSMVREALKNAAGIECRTMASLLDKIITDYLRQEGFLLRPELGAEKRRYLRESIPLASKTILKTGEKVDSIPSVVRDISLGGVKVIFPKDTEITITPSSMLSHFDLCIEFPKDDQQLIIACDAHHIHRTDSEVQIGASFENINTDQFQRLNAYLN